MSAKVTKLTCGARHGATELKGCRRAERNLRDVRTCEMFLFKAPGSKEAARVSIRWHSSILNVALSMWGGSQGETGRFASRSVSTAVASTFDKVGTSRQVGNKSLSVCAASETLSKPAPPASPPACSVARAAVKERWMRSERCLTSRLSRWSMLARDRARSSAAITPGNAGSSEDGDMGVAGNAKTCGARACLAALSARHAGAKLPRSVWDTATW